MCKIREHPCTNYDLNVTNLPFPAVNPKNGHFVAFGKEIKVHPRTPEVSPGRQHLWELGLCVPACSRLPGLEHLLPFSSAELLPGGGRPREASVRAAGTQTAVPEDRAAGMAGKSPTPASAATRTGILTPVRISTATERSVARPLEARVSVNAQENEHQQKMRL